MVIVWSGRGVLVASGDGIIAVLVVLTDVGGKDGVAGILANVGGVDSWEWWLDGGSGVD